MERLLIILAVLTCAAVGVAVVAMSARGRRPPLRMDSELDETDEHMVLSSVGPLKSPIDRSAQVLDAQVLDLEPVEAPRRIEDRTEPDRPAPPAAGR
jgi:hypothetical protein